MFAVTKEIKWNTRQEIEIIVPKQFAKCVKNRITRTKATGNGNET